MCFKTPNRILYQDEVDLCGKRFKHLTYVDNDLNIDYYMKKMLSREKIIRIVYQRNLRRRLGRVWLLHTYNLANKIFYCKLPFIYDFLAHDQDNISIFLLPNMYS